MVNEGSVVVIAFELTPDIDPTRFVEWLQVECNVAEDGLGTLHTGVKIVSPVSVQLHSWDGKEAK